MFETKQAIVDFALQVRRTRSRCATFVLLQIVLAKAYLFQFKYDSITQDIREGEGSVLGDQDSVEVILHTYKLTETGTLSLASSDVSVRVCLGMSRKVNNPLQISFARREKTSRFDSRSASSRMAK